MTDSCCNVLLRSDGSRDGCNVERVTYSVPCSSRVMSCFSTSKIWLSPVAWKRNVCSEVFFGTQVVSFMSYVQNVLFMVLNSTFMKVGYEDYLWCFRRSARKVDIEVLWLDSLQCIQHDVSPK